MGSTSRNASESRNRKQNTVEDQSMKSASFSCDVGVCFWAMDGDLPKTNLDRQIPSVCVKTKDWSLKCLKSRPDLAFLVSCCKDCSALHSPNPNWYNMQDVCIVSIVFYSYTVIILHIMLYSVWNIRVLMFETRFLSCLFFAACRQSALPGEETRVSSRNMPYLGYLWLEGLYPVTSYHIRKMI